MSIITDEYMKQMLAKSKTYTIVILKNGPKIDYENRQEIVWEHGRRNFELREKGILSIVCPIRDGSNLNGIGIFNADDNETKKIMDEDPGVKTGIFDYEIHPTVSFPGDNLP